MRSALSLEALKVKQRWRADKHRRYIAGLLKSSGHKPFDSPRVFTGYGTTSLTERLITEKQPQTKGGLKNFKQLRLSVSNRK